MFTVFVPDTHLGSEMSVVIISVLQTFLYDMKKELPVSEEEEERKLGERKKRNVGLKHERTATES